MVQRLLEKHGHTKIIIAACLISLVCGIGGALIFTPIYINLKLKKQELLELQNRQQQQAVISSIDNKLTIHEALLDTLKNDLTCISISDSLQQIRRICDMEASLHDIEMEIEKLHIQTDKRAAKILQMDTQTRQLIEKLENDIEKLDKEQRQQIRILQNSISELEEKILNMQRRENSQ